MRTRLLPARERRKAAFDQLQRMRARARLDKEYDNTQFTVETCRGHATFYQNGRAMTQQDIDDLMSMQPIDPR